MRYVVAFLFVLALILFGVALFGGHGSKRPANPVVAAKSLPDYSTTDAEVSITTDGVINGDEAHRQIRVIIGQNIREVDVIQGYQNTILQRWQYGNNESAYNTFLRAIGPFGFASARKSTIDNYSGLCPFGQRYTYNLMNTDDNSDFSHWAVSCSTKLGTFSGQGPSLQRLFQMQIPNYGTLVSGVSLNG